MILNRCDSRCLNLIQRVKIITKNKKEQSEQLHSWFELQLEFDLASALDHCPCLNVHAQKWSLVIEPSMSDTMALWTVWENIQDILQLLTFIVGDHCRSKNSQINYADAIYMLLQWYICQVMMLL